MSINPLVSVIMPAYNAASVITKAIDSVLKQKVDLELIIINDHSSDGLDKVIAPYLQDPRVHYIQNQVNRGVAFSRNRGVSLAKGKYVAFLDADDWWDENKLTIQLAVMKRTGAVLSCTAREFARADGSLTGHIVPVGEEITYKRLLRHNCINCSSVLILTSVIKEFPMGHDHIHEDYITWLRVLQKYKTAVGINQPLLKYRLSSNSKSSNKIKSAKMTFLVYRHMGYGYLTSIRYFISYAIHGLLKYRL